MKKSIRGFKKTALKLATLVFAVLLLVSCGTGQSASSLSLPASTSLLPASTSLLPDPSSPSVASEYSEPQQGVGSASLEEGQEVYVAYADEEYAGGFPDFKTPIEYVQNKDGYDVLIWSNKDLAKMSFLDWASFDEGTMKPIPGEELFATGKLPAYTPLKVKIMPYGDLAGFGVRVTSLNGTEKVYFITVSGKDGAVFLMDDI